MKLNYAGFCFLLLVLLLGGCDGFIFDTIKSWFVGDSEEDSGSKSGQGGRKKKKRVQIGNFYREVQVKHREGVEVVDHSKGVSLPKVRMGGRVCDLNHGLHFDSILQDSPDEIRPPSAVVFYNSNDKACMKKYENWNWDHVAEKQMPARERIFLARYDMYAAKHRTWFKFIPEHDLAKRFGVEDGPCPRLVFVPRECNGFLEYCVDKVVDGVEYLGCKDFKDPSCEGKPVIWDESGDLSNWLKKKIKEDGVPKLSKFLRTYEEQGVWMKQREHTTSNTHLRNNYLANAFPGFSKTGFKVIKTPKKFQDWLLEFYERNKKHRRLESWQGESTQMSFHEVKTGFVDLDRERHEKERMADKYIKPLVEEWSGEKLELTAFYGMREYPDGSFLRNHVDRIDTHVLSVTVSVKKLDSEKSKANPWPLEVVQWSGDHVRYEHEEGTSILYESSKLPHGRPYRNNGGVHVGCFIHYKPVNMHGVDAAKWDDIVRAARKHQREWTAHHRYLATPSVEEKNPVYSSKDYGEDTQWNHLDDDEVDTGGGNSGFLVTFKNDCDRTLDLFWQSPEGSAIPQGTLGKSSNMAINTFVGHKFFFAEQGEETPLPGGMFTMDEGRKVYKYSLTKDGGKKLPSKWTKFVKDKLALEED